LTKRLPARDDPLPPQRHHARPKDEMIHELPPVARMAYMAVCLLAGCGGANFERAPGAKKYRALPLNAVVRVAERPDDLSQPVEFIGTLKATTRGDPANRGEAEATFKTHAARYGCDAVADLQSNRREIKTTRKVRTLGPNGVPVYVDEVVVNAEHDWVAQCYRTPDAPPDTATAVPAAAPAPAPAEPAPEVVKATKGKKGDKAEKAEKAAKTDKPDTQEPAEHKPEPKPAEVKPPEPKPAEAKPPEPKPAEPKPAEVKPIDPATPQEPIDPRVATEVAKAFLGWSDAMSKGSADRACGFMDETIIVDLQATQPKLKFKAEMTKDAACESWKGGDLNGYLRDLGPAEVHAEPPTLLPTLFQIHGGAYMRLDDDKQKRYADEVTARRAARKLPPLQCALYNVTPAGDLFKVNLQCNGVVSYRLLMRRAAAGEFKVMQLTHLRP
jgi:hypothetical protein